MRINPINFYSHYNNNKSFKGLWGKTYSHSDWDDVLNMKTVINNYFYYPFKDEKDEDVEKIKKSVISSGEFEVNTNKEYHIEDCTVCLKMPLTTADFELYNKATKKDIDEDPYKYIEMNIAVTDKFINSGIANENQKSAINKYTNYLIREWRKEHKLPLY